VVAHVEEEEEEEMYPEVDLGHVVVAVRLRGSEGYFPIDDVVGEYDQVVLAGCKGELVHVDRVALRVAFPRLQG
jgi:hypothetical protein